MRPMSEAQQSIRDARETPKISQHQVSKATVTRFRERQQAHYQAAQRVAGQPGEGGQVNAHMAMGEACGHVAQSAEHSLASRPQLAARSLQDAHDSYTQAVSHHEASAHEHGGPVRQALGHSEPMAKADGAAPAHGGLPPVADHLHVTLPTGERVHPMSPAGVDHLHETVSKPAAVATQGAVTHLHNLMSGLDVSVKGRAKKADSLAEKVVRKNRPAQAMGDLIGARVVVHNPAHFGEAQRRLQQHMAGTHPMSGHGIDIHAEDDKMKNTPDSGYRSVHYDGQAHGFGMEVQLRQPHHTVWADWAHNNFYKDHELKSKLASTGHEHELGAVKAAGEHYGKQVSDHLHATQGVKGPDAPKTPKILEKHGLGFPWHEL